MRNRLAAAALLLPLSLYLLARQQMRANERASIAGNITRPAMMGMDQTRERDNIGRKEGKKKRDRGHATNKRPVFVRASVFTRTLHVR